ncbi:MAG TPA: cobalamin-dependent protein [Terriglobales bacterium]|nr:cobalamin-dependent protein [Terriglobales bacterium]
MKVLLCHPNQKVTFQGLKARPMVGPPLGLLMIAGHLRSSRLPCDIEIYDARLSATFSVNEQGDTIFGDTDSDSVKRVIAEKPDVVGISNMFTAQIDRAYALADLVKAALPETIVVIGGPHVTVFPQEALARPSIDYVVLGEGEERFTSLIACLLRGDDPAGEGILGKSEATDLKDKKWPIRFIADLDRLPLPAYELVDLEAYFDLARRGFSPRYREWGKRPITMITSRGCPHVCTFCSIHTTMGYKYRFHSLEFISRHINHLVSQYGVDFIHFEDDNFTHLPERYDEIIKVVSTIRPRIGWDTPNGVRGDSWTRERIRQAKESGCEFLTVAIESAVPRVLNEIVRKKLDLDRVEEMIRWCHEFGLRLHAFYIIGFPGETLDEMRTTIAFALDRYRRYGVTPFLQVLIPIPGTPIYKRILKMGFFKGNLETKHNQVTTADFNPDQVRQLYQRYSWQRMGIFAWRTLTARRDLFYNTRLVYKYPHALVHAAKEAIGAASR